MYAIRSYYAYRMHGRTPDGFGHSSHETQQPRHRPDYHVYRRRHGYGHDYRAGIKIFTADEKGIRTKRLIPFSSAENIFLCPLNNHGHTHAAADAHGNQDQVEELKEAGVQAAFNFYAEAGSGFSAHVYETLTVITSYSIHYTKLYEPYSTRIAMPTT